MKSPALRIAELVALDAHTWFYCRDIERSGLDVNVIREDYIKWLEAEVDRILNEQTITFAKGALGYEL